MAYILAIYNIIVLNHNFFKEEFKIMISYDPFWQTLKKKNITTYALIYKHNVSNGTLYRMRKGKPISTNTIDLFCNILNCSVDEVILYIDDKKIPEEK